MQTYPTGYAESHRMVEQIFREILPRRGMAVREEQIALSHEVLDTLYNKEISLCEAGVGIGKTLAYLVACILWQMHRPNQLKMPVVISTSSVALQDAILNEYLPDLSAVLLAEGIITAPITAVVRKGKERFVCDARLAERQAKAISKGSRQKGSLRMAENVLDLDHIPGLSRYDRCRICVPQSCPRDCFLRLDCRYQQYLRDSRKPDIQICNHNYLLANASHRLEERPLLLRQYQALVVDEAHKLPDAARQMYTETLSAQDMDDLCSLLQQAHFKGLSKRLRTVFLTLSISCAPSFAMTKGKISVPFSLTPFRQAAIADCINLLQYIGSQPDMPHYLQYRLAEAESLLRLFLLEIQRRVSCTLSFTQTASSHSAQPATEYRSYSAALCGIPANRLFLTSGFRRRQPEISTTRNSFWGWQHTLRCAISAQNLRSIIGKNVCCISLHGGHGCSQPVPRRPNCAAHCSLPRSRIGVVHILPPDAQCLRRVGRAADAPCVPSRARAESQYPTIQAIRQRRMALAPAEAAFRRYGVC